MWANTCFSQRVVVWFNLCVHHIQISEDLRPVHIEDNNAKLLKIILHYGRDTKMLRVCYEYTESSNLTKPLLIV